MRNVTNELSPKVKSYYSFCEDFPEYNITPPQTQTIKHGYYTLTNREVGIW